MTSLWTELKKAFTHQSNNTMLILQEGFDGNNPIASLVEPLGNGDERSVDGIKSEEEDKAEIAKPRNGQSKRFSCPISPVSMRF